MARQSDVRFRVFTLLRDISLLACCARGSRDPERGTCGVGETNFVSVNQCPRLRLVEQSEACVIRDQDCR